MYRANNRNNSAQVWDVNGVSTADGAVVHLWAYGGGNNRPVAAWRAHSATSSSSPPAASASTFPDGPLPTAFS